MPSRRQVLNVLSLMCILLVYSIIMSKTGSFKWMTNQQIQAEWNDSIEFLRFTKRPSHSLDVTKQIYKTEKFIVTFDSKDAKKISNSRWVREKNIINGSSIRRALSSSMNAVQMESRKVPSQTVLKIASIYSGAEYGDPNLVHIAIGLGITTVAAEGADDIETFNVTSILFFNTLMSSFCKTASPGYNYHFYVAHDYDDPFFSQNGSHVYFWKTFISFVESHCQPLNVSVVTLTLIDCPHTGNPAWAQNDAMLVAHKDNNDFFYRVNDDAEMLSKNWTRKYIETLATFKPPFIGVVGPMHRGGNIEIMTFDFTHQTHIDIFGYHYPRIFTAWYADDWITEVYKPDRSKKVKSVILNHTRERGRRYYNDESLGDRRKSVIIIGKEAIVRYLKKYLATLVVKPSTLLPF